MKDHNILIIDCNALIYRFGYAFKDNLFNDKPNGALIGLFYKLVSIDIKFSKIIFCFDGAKNFRKKIVEEYKLKRKPIPDFIYYQLMQLKKFIKYLPAVELHHESLEADDLIGISSHHLINPKHNIYILTTDKDLLQLVRTGIKVLLMRSKTLLMEKVEDVKDFIGVYPNQIPDLFALQGDNVDNIEGVPGIGPKAALLLLNRFQNIEQIFDNLETIEDKYKKLLTKYKESCIVSKILATIKTTAIEFDHVDNEIYENVKSNLIRIGELRLDKIGLKMLFEEHGLISLYVEFISRFHHSN